MSLTQQQLAALRASIVANPAYSGMLDDPNPDIRVANADAIAAEYNLPAAPDFWVWRTSVSRMEYVNGTSADGTTFAWTGTGFITRSVGERDAWRELFADSGTVNPSLANVRQAFQDIFSGGTAPAPANRTHLNAMSRRRASGIEKLLATGTGSTASPATMGFEGEISGDDVLQAWEFGA